MRFGEFSRAPLQLLRFELRGDFAECDWLSRPEDAWDASLPRPQRDRKDSLQALVDAMSMRELLFEALPEVQSAVLRAFRRPPAREPPELIILGMAGREAPYVLRVASVAMRAKLYGFCFCLEEGFLRPLAVEERTEEFIPQQKTLSGRGGIGYGSK